MKLLLDKNPLSGVSAWFEADNEGNYIISHEQDVTPILEANKLSANAEAHTSKKGIKEGWWHYASIPNILVMKWSQEIGGDILNKQNEKELFKRLNHPDHQHLKATYGQHVPTSS